MENIEKCKKLKHELDDINVQIALRENKIQELKKEMNMVGKGEDEVRADLKNKMTRYGVSKDFIIDALVPNKIAAILKAGSDVIGAPEAREIENLMIQVQKLKKIIKTKEKDIIKEGLQIRPLMLQRDELVKDWRFSGCGKKK